MVSRNTPLNLPFNLGLDVNAAAYIAAVEAADGQTLEAGVKTAINTFVVGCKADGIWDAIKASCILAGARTLSGALVPLAGTAPTNFNFVSGDYDRKTGLIGNGTTKYLNANRNNNADPQSNQHFSAFTTNFIDQGITYNWPEIGPENLVDNVSFIFRSGASGRRIYAQSQSLLSSYLLDSGTAVTGLKGISRSNSTSFNARVASTNYTTTSSSQVPANSSLFVFRSATFYGAQRLAFYSIGAALDLALLDARVTTLISAFDTAILDPYYANVSLLLHGNGTNGSTTITDNSPSPKTVTAVGNAQVSTAQSKFGGASIAFDGTGDWLNTSSIGAIEGSENFTIEAWLYPTAVTGADRVIYETRGGSGFVLFINTSGFLQIYDSVASLLSASTTGVSANTWQHIAVVGNSATKTYYINGLAAGTFTQASLASASQIRIGARVDGVAGYSGYIDDLRTTKGVARYTANFTPPVAQFPDS